MARAASTFLVWLVAASTMVAGCGARSGLDAPPPRAVDAGLDAAPSIDAAPPVDAALPIDAAAPVDAGPPCVVDEDCEDRIACTSERCVDSRCEVRPDDAACDDGLFCTGVERCVPGVGCRALAPSCTDSVACTDNRCDEDLDACVVEPRADLCPISHRCDPVRGCVARALAHDDARLYEVDLPGGAIRTLSALPLTLTDIALHPDGTLYGATPGALVRVDIEAGTVETVVAVPGAFVGLDIAPDGTLYGASDDRIERLDPVLGTATTVARFPARLPASGDLAFVEGRLYATAGRRGAVDALVEIPLDGRAARIVGVTRFGCVWGLAPFGTTLYGLNCEGRLLEIDVSTGVGRELSRSSVRFYGAGAR